MEKKVELEIPDAARTRCPLVNFKARQVLKCIECPHFRGMSDRFPGSNKSFAVRYIVLCAAVPAKREILEVE